MSLHITTFPDDARDSVLSLKRQLSTKDMQLDRLRKSETILKAEIDSLHASLQATKSAQESEVHEWKTKCESLQLDVYRLQLDLTMHQNNLLYKDFTILACEERSRRIQVALMQERFRRQNEHETRKLDTVTEVMTHLQPAKSKKLSPVQTPKSGTGGQKGKKRKSASPITHHDDDNDKDSDNDSRSATRPVRKSAEGVVPFPKKAKKVLLIDGVEDPLPSQPPKNPSRPDYRPDVKPAVTSTALFDAMQKMQKPKIKNMS